MVFKVLKRRLDCKDNFTFFIGASCWESYQLQGEIDRGYWLPFSAPSVMATSKQCIEGDAEIYSHIQSRDLWHGVMSSLGDKEAKIASLMSRKGTSEMDDNACDDI